MIPKSHIVHPSPFLQGGWASNQIFKKGGLERTSTFRGGMLEKREMIFFKGKGGGLKHIMFELKKYRGVMFTCTQDWYKIWKKTGLCFQKLTWGIWQIFTRALESLQIGTLMASFCLKLKMYELKIYRGVLCHDNEEWCKIWRGIDLSVQNWHEEFDKFWPEHSKISKICTLIGFFWTKYIMSELKKV